MQEKIDWYQEVIDLEPSSKLFFPLAKMLAGSDIPRAVDTLQRGLEKHPEFIEARFYFIELLHKNKETEDYAARLKTQLSMLSPMLMRYAGFWQAWGNSILDESQDLSSDDRGLAVAFMAAMFEDESISLTDIFSAGLRTVLGKEANQVSGAQVNEIPVQETEPLKGKDSDETSLESVPQEDLSVPQEDLNVPQKDVNVAQKDIASVAASVVESIDAVAEESEEQFSLRTRSMAEVLAEQGDYTSALEIYRELVQAATTEEEKQDLLSRIVTLSGMSGGHSGHSDQGSRIAAKAVSTSQVSGTIEAKDGKVSSPGKERVISVLATLADRLESRAHS